MQYFDVARILTTHGLQGEVKVEVITDFPKQRFAVGRKLALKSQPDRSLTIVRSRPFKQGWLLKFTGLDSVEKVENLKSQVLVIDKGQQQKLPAGSYYYHEILNSVVVDQDKNCVLGKIVDIESPGANDIWLVREDSGQEYWLPYIKDVVKKVDVAHKKVYVHLMKGLRDEN